MSARGDIKKLIKAAERAGADVRRGRSHHIISVDGEQVAVVSEHSKAQSSDLLATKRALRKAGLKIA